MPQLKAPQRFEQRPFELDLLPGQVTSIVGKNGAGKSSLALHIFKQLKDSSELLPAGRDLCSTSDAHIQPKNTRKTQETSIQKSLSSPKGRYAPNRSQVPYILSELLARHSTFLQKFHQQALHGNSGRPDEEQDEEQDEGKLSPLCKLNLILREAGLGLSFALEDAGIVCEKDGATYPFASMSDGERSAATLAAFFLNLDDVKLVIVDEPERHLHPAIAVPLLEAIVAIKEDLHIMTLSHNLDFARSMSKANESIVLYSVEWSSGSASAWELELLKPDSAMPDGLVKGILGGKKEVLFCEGIQGGIDQKLYSILFPSATVVPVGDCNEVQKSVSSSHNYPDLWIEAKGIVDRDGRDEEQVDAVSGETLFVTSGYSVESLYLHPEVRNQVATAQSESLDLEKEDLLKAAIDKSLKALNDGNRRHLATQRAARQINQEIRDQIPKAEEVGTIGPQVKIEVESPLAEQLEVINSLHDEGKLDHIISCYPMKKSGVSEAIARALKFKDTSDYYSRVRTLAQGSQKLQEILRDNLIGYQTPS